MKMIGWQNCINFAMSKVAIFCVVFIAVFSSFFGCSSDKTAGNSAESGNPEVAVTLDGEFSGGIVARLVSADYDPLDSHAVNLISRSAHSLDFSVSVPPGTYSLEAQDSIGAHFLLQQNLQIIGDTTLKGTLSKAGTLELRLDSLLRNASVSISADSLESATGYVSVIGSTIQSFCSVQNGSCLVQHLPAGDLTLRVRLISERGDTVDFKISSAQVVAGKTSVVGGFFPDSTIYTFIAPLALPVDVDTTLVGYVSDIPLALELDSSQLDLEQFAQMEGRWDVMRISADGSRSKNLPIAKALFDVETHKAVFWVNVDSLNFGDSLKLSFKHNVEEAFAAGVFPTNREYASVWHLDLLPFEDIAEKSSYVAKTSNVTVSDGVVGNGVLLNANSAFEIQNFASTDSLRKTDLNFAFADGFGFSVWVKLNSLQKAQTIFAKGDSQYALRFAPDSGFIVEFFHEANSANFLDSLDSVGYRAYAVSGDSLLKTNEWTYLAFGKKQNIASFFVNGNKIPTVWQTESWNCRRDETKNVTIGPFDGALDELMIAGSLRTDAWNYVTYLNQRPDVIWPLFSAEKTLKK